MVLKDHASYQVGMTLGKPAIPALYLYQGLGLVYSLVFGSGMVLKHHHHASYQVGNDSSQASNTSLVPISNLGLVT
jgi:hypothetical protein